MSNVETEPPELRCGALVDDGRGTGAPLVEVLSAREVPLGGPRAMRVRRTLPQRSRTLIGAWCFADHYGPDDVSRTGGMKVPPHPHTGLQTVSWLFTGEIEHRDSAGNHAMVVPGELNLMTGGRGISHSEISTDAGPVLHGAQLWVALPEEHRDTDPGFAHHVPTPITGPGWTVRVFLGSLLGDSSPVPTYTPLLGAEVLLEPGTSLTVPVEASFEHGVLVDAGGVGLATDDGIATLVAKDHLAHTPLGASTLTLEAGGSWTRLLLLGGPPFGESIVMWWNFIGRTHEEIAGYRADWESGSARFGQVEGYGGQVQRLPAPPLPTARLKARMAPPAPEDPSAWG